MIERSPELEAVTRRFVRAMQARDAETLAHMCSDDPSLRYVGTSGRGWTDEIVREGLGEHAGERPEFEIGEEQVEAFECGPVGWAYWTATAAFSQVDTPTEIRLSDEARFLVGADPGFAITGPKIVTIRGLEGQHLIHRLEWAA